MSRKEGRRRASLCQHRRTIDSRKGSQRRNCRPLRPLRALPREAPLTDGTDAKDDDAAAVATLLLLLLLLLLLSPPVLLLFCSEVASFLGGDWWYWCWCESGR